MTKCLELAFSFANVINLACYKGTIEGFTVSSKFIL